MQEAYKFIFGVLILALGVPIGNVLAKMTKDELKDGKRWFKLIVISSIILAFFFLIIGNDALLFTMLFIAIVTSRSLKK